MRKLMLWLWMGLLLATPRPVAACSCMPPSPPAIAFGEAQAVFAGTVTHISTGSGLAGWFEALRHRLGLPVRGGAAELQAVVAVADSWKGVTTTPVSVLTSASSASCGFAFAPGQQYVIYAFDTAEGLSTNLCTRTAERAQAAADLAFLQAQPPLTLTPAAGAAPAVPLLCGAGVLGAVALGAGLLWWARARRQLGSTR